jgi:sulfite reductase (NADPH) hemoprotein beta-component
VRREGGAALGFDPATVSSEHAPDWMPAAAPSLERVKTTIDTPVTGPGIVPGAVRVQARADAYTRWHRTNVSLQRQEGYCHVIVRLPLGDFTAGQIRVLADLAEAYGDGTVRLTMQQNVLFRWVGGECVAPLYERLLQAGLATPDAGTIGDVVSCPGAESCRLAVTQSRGLGRLLTEHLSARPDLIDLVASGDIKISGCPNGCGQHHIGSIGFQGSVRKVAGRAIPQYFVLVGGGCTDSGAHFGKVVSKVPVHRVPEALDRLLALYRREHQGDEHLGAFFRRVPSAAVGDLLKDLAVLAAEELTEADTVDLGEDRPFAPEIMEGECAS